MQHVCLKVSKVAYVKIEYAQNWIVNAKDYRKLQLWVFWWFYIVLCDYLPPKMSFCFPRGFYRARYCDGIAGAVLRSKFRWVPGRYNKDPEWTKILGGLEWFGTCLWLSIQLGTFGNFIIPTVTHSIIFQRGRLKPPTRMPSFCTKMYQVKDSQSGSVYTVPIPIAGVCFFFVAFRLGSFKNSVVILELCELFAIEVYTPYIPSLSFTWSTYVNIVNVKGH